MRPAHTGDVSEQNPWGQPPPPASQPPSGPPAGGTRPPRRRNTAAIIAVVAAALVAVIAVVAAVTLSGDDPADRAGAGAGSAVASSTSSEEPSSDSSDEPTIGGSSTTARTAPDGAILGQGYYFELPGIGWQDAVDETRSSGLGAMLDSIIILGDSLDVAQSNILVEALTAGGAPDLEALEEQWKRNLSGIDGAVPDDLPDITIDGERAIGVRFTDRENVNGLLIDQVAYLALHDGNQFSVALSLPSDDDTVSEADFEKVLASWTWTD